LRKYHTAALRRRAICHQRQGQRAHVPGVQLVDVALRHPGLERAEAEHRALLLLRALVHYAHLCPAERRDLRLLQLLQGLKAGLVPRVFAEVPRDVRFVRGPVDLCLAEHAGDGFVRIELGERGVRVVQRVANRYNPVRGRHLVAGGLDQVVPLVHDAEAPPPLDLLSVALSSLLAAVQLHLQHLLLQHHNY